MPESRLYNAEYYDAFEFALDDLELYKTFVTPQTDVLELGCGTGRISIPLARIAKSLTGVDISEPMLQKAREKKQLENVNFLNADITKLQLHETFDLLISPYRVLQALETNVQIEGFFRTIHRHLKTAGVAVINVFNPKFPQNEMEKKWVTDEETFCGETYLANGDLLKLYDTRKVIDLKNQVLHPVLIYRRFRGEKLIDEHLNPICMKYYYPEQFQQLIVEKGFEILQTWGGYNGEPYGKGPELVIAFKKS